MAQTNAQTDKLIRFSLLLILTGLDGIPFRRKIKEIRHLNIQIIDFLMFYILDSCQFLHKVNFVILCPQL